MEGTSTYLHIERLQYNAALLCPILLESEYQVLKGLGF
jgi:hypothetical protein